MIKIWNFIIILIVLTLNVNAKTVHWISIFDTNDSNIGQLNENGREMLYEHIVKPFAIVLDSLGFENDLYRLCGDDYTIGKVLHTIQSIQSGPEDLIFVYYAGHGIAMPDSCNTQFPMLMFGRDKTDWIPFDYIRELLMAKDYKAAAIITVSSNSNNRGIHCPPKDYFDSIIASNAEKGLVLPIQIGKGVKNTFLSESEIRYIKDFVSSISGTILSVSTQKGFDSMGGNTQLGTMDLFTCVFIQLLEQEAAEGKIPNIPQMFDDIRMIISECTEGRQLPFYQMTNAK